MGTIIEETRETERLLIACAAGDRQALRRLYDLEARRMVGVALRIVRDRALAEDVVHDVFIRVWEKAGTFDPARGHAKGWLFSVLRHQALNVVRQRAVEAPLDDGVLDALEREMATQARPAVELGALRDCLESLEPVRQRCVLLAYVEGCSHAEIAQKLATPLGTVKAWIRRSLLALKACLG